jgi:hypothetical protein
MQFDFNNSLQGNQPQPHQVHVPFVHQPIGLGDAVAQVTRALGIQPCGGCKKRQEYLNQQMTLNPYRG